MNINAKESLVFILLQAHLVFDKAFLQGSTTQGRVQKKTVQKSLSSMLQPEYSRHLLLLLTMLICVECASAALPTVGSSRGAGVGSSVREASDVAPSNVAEMQKELQKSLDQVKQALKEIDSRVRGISATPTTAIPPAAATPTLPTATPTSPTAASALPSPNPTSPTATPTSPTAPDAAAPPKNTPASTPNDAPASTPIDAPASTPVDTPDKPSDKKDENTATTVQAVSAAYAASQVPPEQSAALKASMAQAAHEAAGVAP